MGKLQQGRIVWARVPDPQGSVKHRPVVVLTSDDEIEADDRFVAVAVTTRIPDPLPEECVELPWARDGRCQTRLSKPAVAVCNWLVSVEAQGIAEDDIGGVVPPSHMQEILVRLPSE